MPRCLTVVGRNGWVQQIKGENKLKCKPLVIK